MDAMSFHLRTLNRLRRRELNLKARLAAEPAAVAHARDIVRSTTTVASDDALFSQGFPFTPNGPVPL